MSQEQRLASRDWEHWGKADPYFGVASLAGRRRSEQGGWENDVESFFELGKADWRAFEPVWEAFGLRRGDCLEIGCGTGRMTRQLADRFERVIAVDVSEGMMERAKASAPGNVEFRLADAESLPASDSSVDAVFSVCVFQHFENEAAGLKVFAEVARVLRPGGTLLVHVPLLLWPSGRFQGLYRTAHRIRRVLANGRAWIHRRAYEWGAVKAPYMRWTCYELRGLREALTREGVEDVQVTAIWRGEMGDGGLHTFVLGRKPVLDLGN